jgi:hypothetical protein
MISPADELAMVNELTVVKLLAAGQTLTFTAAATGLPESAVLKLGEHHGHPDTDALASAALRLQAAYDRAQRAAIHEVTPASAATRGGAR